jgi:RNA methyltransferase, TrmH family
MALTAAQVKYLVSLTTKKGRKQEGCFLAEGVRLLEEALAGGYLPLSILYAPSLLSPRGEALVGSFIERKVEAKTISVRECNRFADTEQSQGILAVFEDRAVDLEQQLRNGCRRILVCDRIGDPGNMGTLIRAAAAFGFDLVVTISGSAEVTSPKTIRSSAGAFFRIPIVAGEEDRMVAGTLLAGNIAVYAADVHGREFTLDEKLPERLALVIGSEAEGSGKLLLEKATQRLRIPMSAAAESLNAAMAGTLMMFWISSRERMLS